MINPITNRKRFIILITILFIYQLINYYTKSSVKLHLPIISDIVETYDAYSKGFIDNYVFKPVVLGNIYQDFLEKSNVPVTVVLIQDSDLRNSSWPLPYTYHVNKLKKITELGAEKVLIDIVFTDERADEGFSDLIDFTCSFNDPDKFFFVTFDYFNNSNKYKGLRKSFKEYDDKCYRIVPAKIDIADKYFSISNSYPVTICDQRNNCVPNGVLNLLREEVDSLSKTQNSINIAWIDGFSHPISKKLGCIDHLINMDSCPRNPYISVSNLNTPDDDVTELINNRSIIYASSLEGARDVFKSPTSGSMPGAFIHAIVYENLYSLMNKGSEIINNKINPYIYSLFIFFILHKIIYLYKGNPKASSLYTIYLIISFVLVIISYFILKISFEFNIHLFSTVYASLLGFLTLTPIALMIESIIDKINEFYKIKKGIK